MTEDLSDVEGVEKLDNLADPFKELATKVWMDIVSENLPFKVFETKRTFKRQNDLYMQGRAVDVVDRKIKRIGKIITGARPGRSPHNWGLACDGVLDIEHTFWSDYQMLPPMIPQGMWDDGRRLGKSMNRIRQAWKSYGEIIKDHGLTWGGTFTFVDMPHFELTEWRKLVPNDWRRIVTDQIGNVPSMKYE